MCSFKDYQKVVEVICVGIPRKKTNILSFNSLEVGAISACVQDDMFCTQLSLLRLLIPH